LTPEEPLPDKPKNPPGRPKMPNYNDMHPVYELYTKVRNRLRKTKPVTAPEIRGWLIEITLLQGLGYDVRVRIPEVPTTESVMQILTAGPTNAEKAEPVVPDPNKVTEVSLGEDL
jgi:hypothetical protein